MKSSRKVHKAIIAGGAVVRLFIEGGMDQEAKCSITVVVSHHDDVLGCESTAIVTRLRAGLAVAVVPYEHGESV